MEDTRAIVYFRRVSGSYNYHAVEKGQHKALCGFEPKPRTRSCWHTFDTDKGERPYFPYICPKCAKKANISPSEPPDNATVRFGNTL